MRRLETLHVGIAPVGKDRPLRDIVGGLLGEVGTPDLLMAGPISGQDTARILVHNEEILAKNPRFQRMTPEYSAGTDYFCALTLRRVLDFLKEGE